MKIIKVDYCEDCGRIVEWDNSCICEEEEE